VRSSARPESRAVAAVATVRANGIDFQVSRFRSGPEGERPIVVTIHGLGVVDGASMSLTVGMPLAKHFDVINYDLRGHGRTPFVPSGYRVADHVGDLTALLDALEIDGPVHLVTGSYGGCVGVTMAHDHPERVKSLAMVDPMFPLPDWGANLAVALGYFADRLNEGATVEDIMDFLQTTARRRTMMLMDRGRKLLFETTLLDDLRGEPALSVEDYARITCPVMGAFGVDSAIYVLSMLLKELIPHVEILEIADADHLQVFLSSETRETLIAFIRRVEAERSLREVAISSNGLAEA
jgi:pimeloyl-ACP methyl ester carboxylesterase